MKENYRDFPPLIDPITKENLNYISSENKEYMQSSDGSKFEILNSIPRILYEDFDYTDAFGIQWNKWRRTQLDSFTGTNITRKRLTRCLGDKICENLNDTSKETHVLEVGCGAGRFTEVLLEYSVKLVSSDLSSAVDANVINCPITPKHQVVQADVNKSPFGPNYDLVICLGVIQHTPNSEDTIKALYDSVKPGGSLVIDHYTHDLKRFTKLILLFRPIIKRLPAKQRMKFCESMVTIFLPIHKAIKDIPFAQMIFSRISPITSYFHAYPELSDELQREWAILDTHDGLTDWNKRLRTPSSIRKTLEKLGATDIEVWKGGNGVEARCKKPII